MLPSGASEAQEAVLTHIKSPRYRYLSYGPRHHLVCNPQKTESDFQGCHRYTCQMVNLPGYLRELLIYNCNVEGSVSVWTKGSRKVVG